MLELAKAVPDIIFAIIDGLAPLVEDLWNEVLEPAISAFTDWAGDIIDKGKESAKAFVETFIGDIKELPSRIWEAIKDGITKITEFGKNLVSKGKELATNTIDAIIDGFSGLPSKLLDVGENAIEGLWNGISNMSDWIGNKISGFSEGVLDGIKDFFGIHSPSTVMRDEVGKNLAAGVGEGYADGMKKAADDALKADAEFLSSPARAFRSDVEKYLIDGMSESIEDGASSVVNSFKNLAASAIAAAKDALSKADIGGIASELSGALKVSDSNAQTRGGDTVTNNTANNTYNFVQNNTSPKSLSRLDIYRQTKNQIAMLKGV